MTDEYTCTWCKNGQVEETLVRVRWDQPYPHNTIHHDTHWQCENCDSTYPSWVYPKNDEGVEK